jgi:hypothetical protein
MSAPERIWVLPDFNDHFNPARVDWTIGHWSVGGEPGSVKFVRFDLHDTLRAERDEALRRLETEVEAFRQVRNAWQKCAEDTTVDRDRHRDEAIALRAERDALAERIERLEEALREIEDCDWTWSGFVPLRRVHGTYGRIARAALSTAQETKR